jgi:putative tryptophan/tyrosine transport system substrate-binding protein
MIERRAVLAGGIAMMPVLASSQTPQRLRRIGWLRWDQQGGPSSTQALHHFRERMEVLGWIEGRNYQLDLRHANSDAVRASALVAEMLAADPELIVATSTPAVRAVVAATRTVPIVMAPAVDPVANGFVPQLSRPGGNVTGVTIGGPEITAKQVELLHETVPG